MQQRIHTFVWACEYFLNIMKLTKQTRKNHISLCCHRAHWGSRYLPSIFPGMNMRWRHVTFHVNEAPGRSTQSFLLHYHTTYIILNAIKYIGRGHTPGTWRRKKLLICKPTIITSKLPCLFTLGGCREDG